MKHANGNFSVEAGDRSNDIALRCALLVAVTLLALMPSRSVNAAPLKPSCTAANTITAKVVALEQVYYYNRFGSFNPAGLMYALRRDVVDEESGKPIGAEPNSEEDLKLAGHVRLRFDKRPRPLVLRVNEGDCLKVTFTNLLQQAANGQEVITEPSTGKRMVNDAEDPATRHASMHVNGLNEVGSIESDGSNVGRNKSSLAVPGETKTYVWYAKQEGGYLFYSMAGPAGGEGDGGQVGLGLFGAVNVQPKGATWYRSQVTADGLEAATTGRTKFGQPIINYDAKFADGSRKGDPVLAILKGKEIIYSDLNAVIKIRPRDPNATGPHRDDGEDCAYITGPGSACGKSYREFTSIFHDEITAVQAYPELHDEENPLSSLRDGTAINYGSSGLGAMVLANRNRVGPARNCPECKLEEFFLTSWANGDPAMVVKKDEQDKPKTLYPDDPSNVHHSYIGDPVRFRNMHAGPKETHVFHLHAHQWVQDKHDPNSVYLDSQTISPGAVFSYEIHYGGSGNRNFVVGDSIFHCHLYPHFAQGMWELWRSHDVFEAGTPDRNLPDGQIAGGTPNPVVVPLPDAPMPLMPSDKFKGYPFYIAGQAGHRPPQPPRDLEMEKDPVTNQWQVAGGLPRHRIADATLDSDPAKEAPIKDPAVDECKNSGSIGDLYNKGKTNSACIAGRVRQLNPDSRLLSLARRLKTARLDLFLPDQNGNDGSPDEKQAMDFHAGKLFPAAAPGPHGELGLNNLKPTAYGWEAKGYTTCDSSGKCYDRNDPKKQNIVFRVNGSSGPKPGAPYANPCPKEFDDDKLSRIYRTAYIQFDMTVNKSGWHDPQARIAVLEQDVKATFSGERPAEPLFFRAKSGECVVYKATNLVPSNLNLDDFQVYSPTDVLGQHIHLVKFDVTSSDGSGNGWNYEDGTLAADEVRERIAAYNRYQASIGSPKRLAPKVHSLFATGNMTGDERGVCPDGTDPKAWDSVEMAEKHPFCGAQTTIQRWWADPLLNKKGGVDRTLRTVFTHDHFGPSSHQHHGLYAALVVEPANSTWESLDGKTKLGTRAGPHADGGPTSYAANIVVRKHGVTCADDNDPKCIDEQRTAREFNMAFADFALLYSSDRLPKQERNIAVNGINRVDAEIPSPSLHARTPYPEGISTHDPGTQLINYRNEPVPLRIGERKTFAANEKLLNPAACYILPDGKNSCFVQKSDAGGEMANVFSSDKHAYQNDKGKEIFTEALGKGRGPGDPATPLLMAYAGDRVQVRLIQGAQEENHIFNMHGVKWLSQPESPNSGYMNAQPIGISEHFEFDVNIHPTSPQLDTDYLYSSTATDNLWDGQWGLLRAFGWKKEESFLKRLPTNPTAQASDLLPAVGSPCPSGTPQRRIDVTAALAKKWLGGPLIYNKNFGIVDAHAIMFVRTKETYAEHPGAAEKTLCENADPAKACWNKQNSEPLILRAAANECIFVTLKNELDPEMPDTVRNLSDPRYKEYKNTWSYNMMPPTVEGFNFNQFTSSNRVGLHPQLVSINGNTEDGSFVGNNKNSTAGPGEVQRYTWYAGDFTLKSKLLPNGKKAWEPVSAPIEFGAIALRDMADVIKHSSHGAIGALVIEPKGAHWQTDLEQGINQQSNATATVKYVDAAGKPRQFREFVVLYQDDLSLQQRGQPMPNLRNGDDAEDTGQKAFNYRSEPIWARLGATPSANPETMNGYDWTDAFSSKVTQGTCVADPAHGKYCDPETPIFHANAGDQVRFRVVHPGGHPRNHGFTVFGHDWIMNPFVCGSDSKVMGWNQFGQNRIGSTSGVGPTRHINILTTAGGDFHTPGDYMYRTQEGFMFGGGLWGIFRVSPETGWHAGPPRMYCEN